MNNARFIYAASQPDSYDLKGGVVWLRGFGLLCLLVIIVYITGKSLVKHGAKGDTSGSFSMVTATVVSLIPLALIGGVAALTGTGGAILATVTKILS